MSAAHTSITGYTIVPSSERMARPSRRPVGRLRLRRMIAELQLRRRERKAWDAELAAERAAAPSFLHPRDIFTLRHAEDEFRPL